jgi:hypothetical protein
MLNRHLAAGADRSRLSAYILFVAAFLGGCAEEPTVNPAEAARHRFAVISLAADEMQHVHSGLTRLDSFDTRNDMRSWQLDDALTARTADAIRRTLGADVVTPAVDRAALAQQVYDFNATLKFFTGMRPPNWEEAASALRSVATANRADRLIVLLRVPDGAFRGFGTYTSISITDNRGAYASIGIYLIDGSTGQEIAHSWIAHPRSVNPFLARPYPKDLPWVEVPKALSTKTPAEMTPAEQSQLREVFLQLVNDDAMSATAARLFGVPERRVAASMPQPRPAAAPPPARARSQASTPASGGFKLSSPQPAQRAAIAGQGARLRGRPADDGPIVQQLAAGTPVQLTSQLENSAGVWWYISAPTDTGWVLQSELQQP